MTIKSAIASGYKAIDTNMDHLNADNLSKGLVEGGYNALGRVGGVAAGLVVMGTGAKGTALVWNELNAIDTLASIPSSVAAQSGMLHKGVEVGAKVIEAGAEVALLGLVANFAFQGFDATVDMYAQTKSQNINLKSDVSVN